MTATLRLVLLVLALAYSAVLGPGHAAAGYPPSHRLRAPRLRSQRPRVRRVAGAEVLGARLVAFAHHLVGVPYTWGGDSPQTGFDCSGLVRFVYAHFGFRLPHSSYADFDLGVRVPRGKLQPGDLVFFDGVGHVGMYVGGGRFIQASHTGTNVQITSLDDPWYLASYDGARRVLPASLGTAARRAAGRVLSVPAFLARLPHL
jgi:peptidoglycan DL-endopeptidase CwlO